MKEKYPATLRGMLDLIDEALCEAEYRGDLADVLSALRGPDEYKFGQNRQYKIDMTAPIRGAAFPKLASSRLIESDGCHYASTAGWQITANPREVRMPRRGPSPAWDHFLNHAYVAAKALRLTIVLTDEVAE